MNNNRLAVTEKDGDSFSVLLWGYPLLLSPSEAILFRAVLDAEAGEALTAKELALRLSPNGSVAMGQVSVLVNRINRKASAITGRKLIVGISHHGYRVNPYI